MKPVRGKVIEASVPCDFCHVSLEDGLDVLNKYIEDEGINTVQNKYLHVSLDCDLLRVIDLSRTYGLNPSFQRDYTDCEWSVYALDIDNNYSHIIYWSPGA